MRTFCVKAAGWMAVCDSLLFCRLTAKRLLTLCIHAACVSILSMAPKLTTSSWVLLENRTNSHTCIAVCLHQVWEQNFIFTQQYMQSCLIHKESFKGSCLLLFTTCFQIMLLLAVQNQHELCHDATQVAVSRDRCKRKSLSWKVRHQDAVPCCTKQCCMLGHLHFGIFTHTHFASLGPCLIHNSSSRMAYQASWLHLEMKGSSIDRSYCNHHSQSQGPHGDASRKSSTDSCVCTTPSLYDVHWSGILGMLNMTNSEWHSECTSRQNSSQAQYH